MEPELGLEMVVLPCHVFNSQPPLCLYFTVGTDWPLLNLRQEVQIAMGIEAPSDYVFYVAKPNNPK